MNKQKQKYCLIGKKKLQVLIVLLIATNENSTDNMLVDFSK